MMWWLMTEMVMVMIGDRVMAAAADGDLVLVSDVVVKTMTRVREWW